MCGIAGIISKNKRVTEEELLRLTSFLMDRGPDYSDIYVDRSTGLAHTRLKIIDLSSNANQPMSRNGITIVFNGEIYNFREIRARNEFKNYPFVSNSDTEVILAAFEIWGIDKLMSEINGMFAFVIYDSRKDVFVFARDRFGKKPLYVFESSGEVSFSSDIRALTDRYSLTLDCDSIDYYLSELSVPQPKTIWKEIRQVRPGSYEVFSREDWNFHAVNYWSLRPSYQFSSEEEVIETVEHSLFKSIECRKISDVPLGYFLSGGVDSGLIVAMQATKSSFPINTFSVGIEGKGFEEDELEDAKRVAERYNTNHFEIKVSSHIIDDLRDVIKYVGEPFADSSIIPTYLISKEIKRNVTVAISGDGGDELFGGYPQYLQAFKSEKLLETYPNSFSRNIRVLWDKIESRFTGRENMGSYQHFHNSSTYNKLSRNMGFTRVEKDHLYLEPNERNFSEKYLESIWGKYEFTSLSDQVMATSLETRLLNDYLVKVDRASMYSSLEVRSPFLDYNLANIAFSIPPSIRFKNGMSKYVLKKLAEKYIRPDIMNLPKKGFSIPIYSWMRNEWKDHIEEHLECLISRQIFNSEFIRSMWSKYLKGDIGYSHRIWSLYCLEVWFDTFYSSYSR